MMIIGLQEGDSCPDMFCSGTMVHNVENCTCHISPPCSACTESVLECDECGETYEEDDTYN